MKYLFANKFKKVGLLIFVAGLIMGLIYLFIEQNPPFFDLKTFSLINAPVLGEASFFEWIENNLFDEIIGVFIITGALLTAFSKEKYEDEFIAKIRLESLVWAIFANYIILVFSILFVYGMSFFSILVYNMFITLFFFLARFNWVLNKVKKD